MNVCVCVYVCVCVSEGKANLGSAHAVQTPVECLLGNWKKLREFLYEEIPFHTLDVLLLHG